MVSLYLLRDLLVIRNFLNTLDIFVYSFIYPWRQKMQQGIHPDYHEITVRRTNGETFKTRSTYGKKDSVLQLDIGPETHPAWNGGASFFNEKSSSIAKFRERFGDFKFGSNTQPETSDNAASKAESDSDKK